MPLLAGTIELAVVVSVARVGTKYDEAAFHFYHVFFYYISG